MHLDILEKFLDTLFAAENSSPIRGSEVERRNKLLKAAIKIARRNSLWEKSIFVIR